MKIYGQPDQDQTAYNTLLAYLKGEEPKAILHHQRQPPNARPCKGPMSLRVQAIMQDGRIITAHQANIGTRAIIKEN